MMSCNVTMLACFKSLSSDTENIQYTTSTRYTTDSRQTVSQKRFTLLQFSSVIILLSLVTYSQADVYPSRRLFLRSTLVQWVVLEFAISRSRVQILLEATLRNNPGQVVYTYVPLSPSSITWYRPFGGNCRPGGK